VNRHSIKNHSKKKSKASQKKTEGKRHSGGKSKVEGQNGKG